MIEDARTCLPEALSLVFATSLRSGEKLLLLSLLRHADWQTGKGSFPSVETLSLMCSFSTRNVQLVLRRLEGIGVVRTEPYPSGRRSSAGYGRTDCRTVVVERLRELAREDHASDEPALGQGEGRNPRPPGVQSAPHRGAMSSPNLSKKPKKNQPPPPVKGERTADREVEAALLAEGVSKTKASTLSAVHTLDEVRAAKRRVARAGPSVRSPGGLMVHFLEDGTAGADARADAERRARQNAADANRAAAAAIGRLFRAVRTTGPEGCRAEATRMIREIRDAWASDEGIAAAGVVTADELGPAADPWTTLGRLHAAALVARGRGVGATAPDAAGAAVAALAPRGARPAPGGALAARAGLPLGGGGVESRGGAPGTGGAPLACPSTGYGIGGSRARAGPAPRGKPLQTQGERASSCRSGTA